MIPALHAHVRPRVISPDTGDVLFLEDEAAEWLEANERGAFEIVGGPGAGKTTALSLLSAALERCNVQFLDEPSTIEVAVGASKGLVIYATPQPLAAASTSRRLASWSDDDLLEYVLGVYPSQCASIMARVRSMSERRRLQGMPQVWRLILDELARDEGQADFHEIIKGRFATKLSQADAASVLRWSLAILLAWEGPAEQKPRAVLAATPAGREVLGWLRHRVVQITLAAWYFALALEDGEAAHYMQGNWPSDLLAETGRRLAERPDARRRLDAILCKRTRQYPVGASLLHASNCGWRPSRERPIRLSRAVLPGAAWPGIDLSHSVLRRADLSRADLSGASLEGACAGGMGLRGAMLARANLRDANFDGCNAAGADFSDVKAAHSSWKEANFSRANLCRADLRKADLSMADFSGASLAGAWLNGALLSGAILAGADLSHADLSDARLRKVRLTETVLDNACLEGADLSEADLEGLSLADARLEDAILRKAHLTGSYLPNACLRGADLQEAGLADVHWEFADLRDADFTNASFHLGSSRSGLVGSPLACEGSRTGFYTDDFDEQGFKSPEEIRKANLRGADLRGAEVEGADFYLVDLRDAKYDSRQAQHFARCKAILYDQHR